MKFNRRHHLIQVFLHALVKLDTAEDNRGFALHYHHLAKDIINMNKLLRRTVVCCDAHHNSR